jgi:hypothetical protein
MCLGTLSLTVRCNCLLGGSGCGFLLRQRQSSLALLVHHPERPPNFESYAEHSQRDNGTTPPDYLKCGGKNQPNYDERDVKKVLHVFSPMRCCGSSHEYRGVPPNAAVQRRRADLCALALYL